MDVGDEIRQNGRLIAVVTAKYGRGVRYFSWRCAICNSEPGGHYGANGGGIREDATKHSREFHPTS